MVNVLKIKLRGGSVSRHMLYGLGLRLSRQYVVNFLKIKLRGVSVAAYIAKITQPRMLAAKATIAK